jgi:hypothetical protein
VSGEQDAYGMLSKSWRLSFYEQANVPVVEQAGKDPSSSSSSRLLPTIGNSDTTGPLPTW